VGPVAVLSVEEEEALVAPCRKCGASAVVVVSEDLWPIAGRWYDALVFRCDACRAVAPWVFDITAFYEPAPGLWKD